MNECGVNVGHSLPMSRIRIDRNLLTWLPGTMNQPAVARDAETIAPVTCFVDTIVVGVSSLRRNAAGGREPEALGNDWAVLSTSMREDCL